MSTMTIEEFEEFVIRSSPMRSTSPKKFYLLCKQGIFDETEFEDWIADYELLEELRRSKTEGEGYKALLFYVSTVN